MHDDEPLESWARRGACKDTDAEKFFAGPDEEHETAKRICRHCPVRYECLKYALSRRIGFGLWGGLTVKERTRIINQHPEVGSWDDLVTEVIRNRPI